MNKNTIKRNANYLVLVTDRETNAFLEDERIECYKNNSGWHIYNNNTGKTFLTSANQIRTFAKEIESQGFVELPKAWQY
jgi:hypothetical protein